MKIRIAGFVQESIVDGPGYRLAIFVQGCPHKCEGCHNPHTHDFDGGWEVDTSEIIGMMECNPLIDGITLSGGEPFCQAVACKELADAARHMGLSVWCYTGFTWEGLWRIRDYDLIELLKSVDVLVDGPYIEEQRTLELPWRGSKNQRVLNVEASLRRLRPVDWPVYGEGWRT